MTEQLLYQAFDLQRFAPNRRLQAVIDACHARTAVQDLTDDELQGIAAAGTLEPKPRPKELPQ